MLYVELLLAFVAFIKYAMGLTYT